MYHIFIKHLIYLCFKQFYKYFLHVCNNVYISEVQEYNKSIIADTKVDIPIVSQI